jgi:enoyl-CoA hydratase/carnithine racemase
MGWGQMNLTQAFAEGGIVAALEGHVGVLTISNARRKNALNLAMWQAVAEATAWLVAQDARVIILQGDGGVDFSAGADISAFDEVRKDTASALAYEAANSTAFAALREAPVPVIAKLRGICFGGGLGLAAAADIRIGDETGRFSVPAGKLGLAYPADAMADIVAALGQATARLAVFTARQFTAADLAGSGFLTIQVENAVLDDAVARMASDIAANAPLSVRASKVSIRAVVVGDAALQAEAARLGAATFDSTDYREGRAAFAEKRKAVFTGW